MNIKLNALSERKYSINKFTNHFYDFRISISCEGIILIMSQNPMVSIKGNDIAVQLFCPDSFALFHAKRELGI